MNGILGLRGKSGMLILEDGPLFPKNVTTHRFIVLTM